jgi:hypothetical protein
MVLALIVIRSQNNCKGTHNKSRRATERCYGEPFGHARAIRYFLFSFVCYFYETVGRI